MPTKAKQPQKIVKIAQASSRAQQQSDGSIYWTNTPPPLESVKAGECGWRAIWCAGYDLDEAGNKHYHHLECIPCHCPPGPQVLAQYTTAREVGLGGGRGSAKSESTFEFATRGNVAFDLFTRTYGYDTANPRPADISYLNCPDYSFVVFRKNSKDLQSYFKRASIYFKMFGGEMTQEPMGVKFPSGAWGIFDHLADADAYEKYVGQQFTRGIIEEANQIPDERLYLKIKASIRTSNPDMKAQLMLTFNPGSRWVKSRFITPGGKRLPFGERYVDPYSGQDRIMIFSTVDDNPYLLAQGYDKELDSYRGEDMALYKQWRGGDFDAQAGQFFPMFREKPLDGEPENACHILPPSTERDPSWPIAISCDWGYDHPAAVYWGAWSPKKQLHVYREFVTAGMGERELGVQIAQKSLDDLAKSPNPHFNLFLSHDAFHRENEGGTEASRIAEGIDSVLGKGAAFIFDRTEEERLLDDHVSWESVKQRAEKRRKTTYITVVNAGLRRRGNMNLIRDMMRWTSLDGASMKFDPAIHQNILRVEGEHNAQEYVKKCAPRPPEYLPALQIYFDGDAPDPRDRGCEQLVSAIPNMVKKENDREEMEKIDGDDPVDALAYLVGNFPFQIGQMSDEAQLMAKIKEIREKASLGIAKPDMNGIIRAVERAEAAHEKRRKGYGFNISRVTAPMRHRLRARAS